MNSDSCWSIKHPLHIISVILLASLFCVVPEGIDSDTRTISRIGNDTVSPYGQLVFTFSKPLEKNQIPWLEFYPPFFSFSYKLNSSSDTLYLELSEHLKGNTRYIIRPSQESGSFLDLSAHDSMGFHTFPIENEPNDSEDVCDTVRSENIFGNLSRSDDTDIFLLRDTTVQKFHFHTFKGAMCSITLYNMEGESSSAVKESEELFTIPEEMAPPVYMKISSVQLSNDGYYQISPQP
ncbi:MAG: hypothetical protein ACLFQB_12290 [Chitinispirillaceae bacterium]